jgi:hypothetical protein
MDNLRCSCMVGLGAGRFLEVGVLILLALGHVWGME